MGYRSLGQIMVDESTIVVPILIVMWDWKFIVELAVKDLIYVKRILCGKNCDRIHCKTQ